MRIRPLPSGIVKKHLVRLPYEPSLYEKTIHTKSRHIKMNYEICHKVIHDLLERYIISPSKSPWSCAAFNLNNSSKIELVPQIVINYKPLNCDLWWIRYPIQNKKDLLHRLYDATIFSKFDIKFGFWQIQIDPRGLYKTIFTIPFG